MHHRKSGRHLSRTSSHRRALFRNLAISLFEASVIRTTVAKAKELRRFAEPLITLAKEDTLAHRRLAFDRIRHRATVTKLFTVIGPACKDRKGGYLRILKCGFRHSDAAPVAYIEIVDRDKFEAESKPVKKAKKEPKKAAPKKA